MTSTSPVGPTVAPIEWVPWDHYSSSSFAQLLCEQRPLLFPEAVTLCLLKFVTLYLAENSDLSTSRLFIEMKAGLH